MDGRQVGKRVVRVGLSVCAVCSSLGVGGVESIFWCGKKMGVGSATPARGMIRGRCRCRCRGRGRDMLARLLVGMRVGPLGLYLGLRGIRVHSAWVTEAGEARVLLKEAMLMGGAWLEMGVMPMLMWM